MISALLLILKIIGITLLLIFGLFLLILFLVLFVPIRYRARVVHAPEKTQIDGQVRFLFPFFCVTLRYLEGFSYKVRVFGYAILNSEKVKQPKQKKAKKPKKPKKKERTAKAKKKNAKETNIKSEQILSEEPDIKTEPVKQNEMDGQEAVFLSEELKEKEWKQKEKTTENKKTKKIKKITQCKTETKKKKENKAKKNKKDKKDNKEKKSLKEHLEKLKQFWCKKQQLQEILGRTEHRKAISFLFGRCGRLLRHILPRKCTGFIIYGSSDPCTTGKILGVVSMLYAKTGQLLEIQPNFEEEQLECDIELKGHIQLFTLVFLAGTVFFHKQLRKMVKEIRQVFRTA